MFACPSRHDITRARVGLGCVQASKHGGVSRNPHRTNEYCLKNQNQGRRLDLEERLGVAKSYSYEVTLKITHQCKSCGSAATSSSQSYCPRVTRWPQPKREAVPRLPAEPPTPDATRAQELVVTGAAPRHSREDRLEIIFVCTQESPEPIGDQKVFPCACRHLRLYRRFSQPTRPTLGRTRKHCFVEDNAVLRPTRKKKHNASQKYELGDNKIYAGYF